MSYRDSLDLSSQGGSHTDPDQEAEQGADSHESTEPPMLPDTEPPEEELEPEAEQDLSVSLAELNVNQSNNNNLPCSPVVSMLGLPMAPLHGRKLVLTRNRSSMPEFV